MYIYLKENSLFDYDCMSSWPLKDANDYILQRTESCQFCDGSGVKKLFGLINRTCDNCMGNGQLRYYQKEIVYKCSTCKDTGRYDGHLINAPCPCTYKTEKKEVESVEGPLDSSSTTTLNKCEVCGGIGYFHHNGTTFTCGCAIKEDSPTKPSHYGNLDVFTYAKEHFTVEEVNAYHQITAIKYLTRAGKKDGNPFEQDIKKAITHLEECLKGEEE